MPIVSYNYANNNHARMKDSILYLLKWIMGFMITVWLLGSVFSKQIVTLFMNNEAVIQYSSHFIRGLLLAMPFLGIDFLTVGVFQAIGNGKKAFNFAILRKIVFEIPAIIILNYFFGVYGLSYAGFIAEFVLAGFSLIFLRDLFRTN